MALPPHLACAMVIYHDPRCVEYSRPGHPERPERIVRSVPLLKQRHPKWEWREAEPAKERNLLRAHTREHVELIKTATDDFDVDTPIFPKIYEHALRSAGAAIATALGATRGERAFSLMRPPGHHATRNRAMGFCYFNNIAVAALAALDHGLERIAIWDFDAHHGNGTEDIVAHNGRIAFASIHQSPGYPGTGLHSFANIDNYPIAPNTPRAEHVNAIERALHKLLLSKPDLLLVSAGFDAYAGDPITEMTLEPEDFATFGKWVAGIDLPAAAILEGGYSDELPNLMDTFLTAWETQATESDW
jgi:acetoin utilization deacetylase AcuC-like enzyme